QLSCTLVLAPIRITCSPPSPRITAPYHTLASAPISTFPMIVAFGAIQALGWILGDTPSNSSIIVRPWFPRRPWPPPRSCARPAAPAPRDRRPPRPPLGRRG